MRKWMAAILIALLSVAGLSVSPVSASGSPAAPQIVKVETVRGAATLTWNSVSGAAGYNVYRNGSYNKTVTGTTYRDGNTAGNYTYYVTAFDSTKKNFSTKSNQVNADTTKTTTWPATTQQAAPVAATSGKPATPVITAANTRHKYVNITFTEVAGAAGYNVYRGGQYLETITSSPYTDNTWAHSAHRYQISAFDSTKKLFSAKSNEVTLDTTKTTTWSNNNTTAPKTETATPVATTDGTPAAPSISKVDTTRGVATLHWSPVAGAAGYNVYRNGQYLKHLPGGSVSSYRDGNSAAVYKYYITAWDSSKTKFSPKSNEVTADTRGSSTTVGTAPTQNVTKLSAPRIFSAETADRFTTIVWQLPQQADGVNVYRKRGQAAEQFVGSVNSPGTVFHDFSGVSGDSYRVIAYKKENGSSTFSTSSNLVNVITPPPVTVLAARLSTTAVRITWTEETGVLKGDFKIYRDGVLLKSLINSSTLFDDQNAVPGRTHTYQISSTRNGSREGPKSVRVTVKATPEAFELESGPATMQRSSNTLSFDLPRSPATVVTDRLEALDKVDRGESDPDSSTRLGAYASTTGYPKGTIGHGVNEGIRSIYTSIGTVGQNEIGTFFNSPEVQAVLNQPADSEASLQLAKDEYAYWDGLPMNSLERIAGRLMGITFSPEVRFGFHQTLAGEPEMPTQRPGGDGGCESSNSCPTTTTKPWTPDPKCEGSLDAAESCG